MPFAPGCRRHRGDWCDDGASATRPCIRGNRQRPTARRPLPDSRSSTSTCRCPQQAGLVSFADFVGHQHAKDPESGQPGTDMTGPICHAMKTRGTRLVPVDGIDRLENSELKAACDYFGYLACEFSISSVRCGPGARDFVKAAVAAGGPRRPQTAQSAFELWTTSRWDVSTTIRFRGSDAHVIRPSGRYGSADFPATDSCLPRQPLLHLPSRVARADRRASDVRMGSQEP
jgi:hypothetical protein